MTAAEKCDEIIRLIDQVLGDLDESGMPLPTERPGRTQRLSLKATATSGLGYDH